MTPEEYKNISRAAIENAKRREEYLQKYPTQENENE
jgi:hypothetical protein